MSTKKKILIGILSVLGLLIIGAVAFVAIMLSRINYVPKTTTAAVMESPEPSAEVELAATADPAEIASPSATPEEETNPEEEILAESEIDLHAEMEQTELTPEEQALLDIQKEEGDVVNILLIGVDRRGKSGNSRSDTMLIATLDKVNKKLKLTSLMRDMYVPIPGKGSNRINSACVFGGPDLLMKTVNENFKLSIEHYVLVDFRIFEQVVDQLGGVTIEMSKGEVAEANDCIAGLNKQRGASLRSGFITKRGGDVTLTGKQALGYARIRHFGNGDYARTSRQFKVLQEIFKNFRNENVIKQTQVLYDVLPLIETNLSSTEILSLATQAVQIDLGSLLHYRLPVEGKFKARSIRGMSVLLPDLPANAAKLHAFIYDATEQEELPYSDTQTGSYYKKTPKTPTPTQAQTPEPIETAEPVPNDDGLVEVIPDEASTVKPASTPKPTAATAATEKPKKTTAPEIPDDNTSFTIPDEA